MLRDEAWGSGDRSEVFRAICEGASQVVGVDRVGIWLYDENRESIVCANLFSREDRSHSQGTQLWASSFPAYFSALDEERVVAADQAMTDPRTLEFAESYLRPLDIFAMLDAPILTQGRCVGVVCCENVGSIREWSMEDEIAAGSVADMTALAIELDKNRQAEEEQRRLERKVFHAQKLESLGVLAGGIAHDFNNLLVAVLGNADLALSELSPTASSRRYIEDIRKIGQRAADLAGQMLAYSGKGKFVVEVSDISALVEEMAHLVHASISKKVSLRLDLTEDLPRVEVDVTQIRQIILNLITNASDAIGENNGVITVSTRVRLCDAQFFRDQRFFGDELDPGTYVTLEVMDTGCGMDQPTIGKMFDPFYSTKRTGRGLGMAAGLGIARGHSGGFLIYSELGKGTSIKLLVPVSDSQEIEDPRSSSPAVDWRGCGTVLLVDDEEVVRSVGKQMIETFGFEVLTAVDGFEGLELFKQRRDEIVLVLLDMSMPGMDGEETLRALRSVDPEATVILTSGYNQQEATSRFVGKGLAGFIGKPYQLDQLRELIFEVLGAAERS